ncbi:MAG: hypothetical protein IPP87_25365 [Ideonella sp.]|nr:hypothetical protein [Ideonella sp.]MBL0151801.1 hypothetical protein [Ideonella sp.]
MFPDLNALLAPAVIERLVLLANHVIASEPEATRRLQPHQGRVLRLEFDGWPKLLPVPPALAFRVTPAGLVEWCGDVAESDLRVQVPAHNPAALALGWLSGELPALSIEGDAQFAADADWMAKNLRWDIGADLERFVGPVAAHQLQSLGSAVARGLKAAVQGASALAGKIRPKPGPTDRPR